MFLNVHAGVPVGVQRVLERFEVSPGDGHCIQVAIGFAPSSKMTLGFAVIGFAPMALKPCQEARRQFGDGERGFWLGRKVGR